MAFRGLGLSGPVRENRRRSLAALADQHDVPLERLIEVIRARKRYKAAQRERRRARERSLQRNPKAKARPFKPRTYAGEGELHSLLREIGMTAKQFTVLAGIGERTFHAWFGHPLPLWPIQLVYYVGWCRNMAAALRERGIDPEKFCPQGLPPTTDGRYPRTKEQGEEITREVERELG